MLDVTGIGPIVEEYICPLIGTLSDPQPGQSVGILVGVTRDGARDYFHFGDVGLHSGDSVVPIEDKVFFIGSNTKVFTATLLALAATARTPVTPSTCVKSLLPSSVGINQPFGDILLWHLATHSAGFPDGTCGPRPTFGDYPFTSMGRFLSDFTPSYAPGKYWVYSNQGFALLGVLLSHAYAGGASSGWDASYQIWPGLAEMITAELRMPCTQVDYSNVSGQVAQGYAYTDAGGTPAYVPVDPPNMVLTSAALGAGALSSTLKDMLTFLEASISPPQGSLGAAMTETQQPYPGSEGLSMGLGWELSNEYLDKNGGLDGYKTYMAFDPGRKIGLFLFGNTSGGTRDALTDTGRLLLGALRDDPACPSVFPHPSSIPQCP
jgi:CubicO group peptidase (beta-lactamase class C family)